jgi:NAD(P)-dependent dehydrogenase (short-subunit alcohol dehydrogenase family)
MTTIRYDFDRAVVVTGASTGIGWGTTKVLTEAGFHVFPVVRKAADADRLKSQFEGSATPLIFDVTDPRAVAAGAEQVAAALGGKTLLGLVNNAGIALSAPLIEQPLADFRRQIEVNLIGQVSVIQAFSGQLGVNRALNGKPGRIINISSVGGRIGPPLLAAYAASKHGIEGLSESLRRELMIYGIDVVIVAPGSVATPIWDKADAIEQDEFEGDYAEVAKNIAHKMIEDGRKGFPPEHVGKVVLSALTSRRPKTRYAVVPGKFVNWTLPTRLPSRLVDRIIAHKMGLIPNEK